jgi:hypothetical protein
MNGMQAKLADAEMKLSNSQSLCQSHAATISALESQVQALNNALSSLKVCQC